MLKERLVYDTTFYSGLVAEPYMEREGGDMHFSVKSLEQAFKDKSTNANYQEALDNHAGAEKEALAFATELFGTLVDGEGVTPVETPAGWAKGCFDTLEAQTEWRQLQRLCEHRKDIAAMTTAGLLNRLAPLLSQVREQEKEKEKGRGSGDGEGEGEGEGGKPAPSGAERALEEKIQQVVQGAKKDAEDACSAYGALAGTGMNEQQKGDADQEAKQKILRSVSTSPHFKKLMDLVGRMQNVMKAKMALTDEKQVLLADIEYGDDLRRLSTLEFANLAMPETETLFLKRYAERKLAIRKASGHSNKGRGDMIILLDESGSMEGTRFQLACAFAVAMVQLAIKEKRKAVVMGFNGRVTYIMKFDGLKAALVHRGSFREQPAPAAELISQILNRSANGGTHFGRVMSKALDMLQDMPEGDLVMVTDAYDQMPLPVVERCETLKRTKGVRTSALFINEYYAHDKEMVTGHENWADQIWRCDTNPETLLDSLTSMAVEAIK